MYIYIYTHNAYTPGAWASTLVKMTLLRMSRLVR